MATRNIVPRADGEGCIGTESKKWKNVNAKTLTTNGITTLQRNKAYEIGDIAYSANLPSWAYLECITAGTTGDEEPNFSDVSSTGGAIANMTDGTAHWRVRDNRCRYEVGDIIAKTTTPKNYEYLLPCDGSAFDKTKYPLLAEIFTDGKTPTLNNGCFLEGSGSPGMSKDAGIPNITGRAGYYYCYTPEGHEHERKNGAFTWNEDGGGVSRSISDKNDETGTSSGLFYFDASQSNPIYGKADTVQPKSYTVVYYVCYGG